MVVARLLPLALAVGMAGAQTLKTGSVLPQIKGTTLADQEITLPDAASGKVTLLVITFSKAAGEQGRAWTEHFVKEYPQDDKTTSYTIAMLGDVPSLFRGMVRTGMKHGVPASLRQRFITTTKEDEPWKQYVGVKDDKALTCFCSTAKARCNGCNTATLTRQFSASLKPRSQIC